MLALAGIAGRPGTEDDVLPPGPRGDAENAVAGLAERGVRSSTVHFAPLAHGTLDRHGFTPTPIGIARQAGFAACADDGANRRPACHTLDAARQRSPQRTRRRPARARTWWATRTSPAAPSPGAWPGIRTCPRSPSPPRRRGSTSAPLGHFVTLDSPTSSARAQDLLEWQPVHPGLLEDPDAGRYFAVPPA